MSIRRSDIVATNKRLQVLTYPKDKKWTAECEELRLSVSGVSEHQALFNIQKAAEYCLASQRGGSVVYASW